MGKSCSNEIAQEDFLVTGVCHGWSLFGRRRSHGKLDSRDAFVMDDIMKDEGTVPNLSLR